MRRVQAPGRQLRGTLGRAGALGFNSPQGERLRCVDFQGHPAAHVIQTFRQGEPINGPADQ